MIRQLILWIFMLSLGLQAQAVSPTTTSVKLISNWASPTELVKIFERYGKESGSRWNQIQLTDAEEADYYRIINFPMPGVTYVPERAIFVQMEELENRKSFFPPEWIQPDARNFLYCFDERNSLAWDLGKSYRELMKEKIKKSKQLSSITSSEYRLLGHIKRIQFLQYLDSVGFKYDLYGKSNTFNLKSYSRPLPPLDKNEGLLPYKYTIACENASVDGYFTEKIFDAILAECLCFYWGCPNLESYLDPQAFIRLDIDHPEQALDTIKKAMANHEWEKRIEVIRKEKQRCLQQIHLLPVLEKIIQQHQQYEAFANYRQQLYPFYGDQTLLQLAVQLSASCQAYVETNSHRGVEAQYLAQQFPQLAIVGCSNDKLAFSRTQASIQGLPNVNEALGDSLLFLQQVGSVLPADGCTLYYLDIPGHSLEQLKSELSLTLKTSAKYYILIPHIRSYGERGVSSLGQLLPPSDSVILSNPKLLVAPVPASIDWLLITNQVLSKIEQ